MELILKNFSMINNFIVNISVYTSRLWFLRKG